jgi:hypothetical protein
MKMKDYRPAAVCETVPDIAHRYFAPGYPHCAAKTASADFGNLQSFAPVSY